MIHSPQSEKTRAVPMSAGDVGGDLGETSEASAAIDEPLGLHIDVVKDATVLSGEPRTWAKVLSDVAVAQARERLFV